MLPRLAARSAGRFALALSLVLALLLALAPTAQAAFSSCRGDPVFILSDGTVLDVQVEIGTSVTNVREIHYVVHGPRGVRLIASIATPTIGFQGLETVSYVADAAPNQYVTDTIVHTAVNNVRATSYTTFAGNTLLQLRLGLTAQYRVIEGWAGQHLIATLSK